MDMDRLSSLGSVRGPFSISWKTAFAYGFANTIKDQAMGQGATAHPLPLAENVRANVETGPCCFSLMVALRAVGPVVPAQNPITRRVSAEPGSSWICALSAGN
jgi:hypothetical protein